VTRLDRKSGLSRPWISRQFSRAGVPEPITLGLAMFDDLSLQTRLWIAASCVLAVVGVGIGFYSIFRRMREFRWMREEEFTKRAKLLVEEGKPIEALKALSEAESRWAINSHNGSVKSQLRDYERLARTVDNIREASEALGQSIHADKLLAAIDRLMELLGDKSGFRIDRRSMKPDTARKYAALFEDFQRSRKALRQEVRRIVEADCAKGVAQ